LASDVGDDRSPPTPDEIEAAERKGLRRSLWVSTQSMVGEFVIGLASGVLAEVGNAVEKLGSNVLGTVAAMVAKRLALRPADHEHTRGHASASLGAGLLNAAALSATGAWLVFEGVHGYLHPEPVNIGLGLAGAGASLLTNAYVALGFGGGKVGPLRRLARVPIIRRTVGAPALENVDFARDPATDAVLEDNRADIMTSVAMLGGLGLVAAGIPQASGVLAALVGLKVATLGEAVGARAYRALRGSPPPGLDPRDLIMDLEQDPDIEQVGMVDVTTPDGSSAHVMATVLPRPGLGDKTLLALSRDVRERLTAKWRKERSEYPELASFRLELTDRSIPDLYVGGGGRTEPASRRPLPPGGGAVGTVRSWWHRQQLTRARSRLGEGERLDLRDRRLRNLDLQGVDLTKISGLGAKIDGSDLRGARLNGADLGFASAPGVDLRNATAEGLRADHARFDDAHLDGLEAVESSLREARAIRARAIAKGLTLRGVDARRSDWSGARIVMAATKTDFRGAVFDGAVLLGHVDHETRFDGASFVGASVGSGFRAHLERTPGFRPTDVDWVEEDDHHPVTAPEEDAGWSRPRGRRGHAGRSTWKPRFARRPSHPQPRGAARERDP
jgi:cation diffusion facilitator family transporter